ncbi:hypothetical protein pipiens_001795 [Culex pipiens pipiens]|uniref:Ionotropic receptor n=1 Tax=Culex pipiens pipiens TaxID=38569 RepID=A0ABD1DUJ9_CULPP
MKLFLILTCFIRLSQLTSSTSRYILSVIEHLTTVETGVRNCVFYGLRPDSTLEEVLRAPQRKFTPKLVYTERRKIPVGVDRLPSEHLLFMVDGTDIKSDLFRIVDAFNATNPSTRLLVLIDTISGDYRVLERLLRHWSFSNVVYLDEKRRRMYLADTVKRVRIGYLVPPSELYNGTMLNDSVLGPIFVNSTDSVSMMDKVHAYVTKRDMANYILPLYYDQKQRINRYAIMDETFGTWPKVFMLSQRNPFLTILGYTYITFVESGIMTVDNIWVWIAAEYSAARL